MGVMLLSLVAAAMVAALISTWGARRPRTPPTPAERYQRDVHAVRLATYIQTKPRYTGQVGNPEGGFNASGGAGLGGGFGS